MSLAIVLAASSIGCSKKAEQKAPPPPTVTVAGVKQQPVPLEVRAIGNVEAFSAVDVKPQVAGLITNVHFQEGQEVKQGQLLFEIDPRQFDQAVREAEATVADRRAALAQAEANYQRDVAQARTARAQAGRYEALTREGIIAREQNEQIATQALAAEKATAAAQAQIESARAAVLGAEARLADARLQLNYTKIRAPISGRTGNVTRKTGNLVAINDNTPLVTINQITPVYATFSVPEQQLAQLRSYAANGQLTVQAQPQTGSTDAVQGVLDFLDNRVDPATGTILLKARFPNEDRRLWPGQFVNLGVRLANPVETVIPTAALRTAQQGNYVFVVKPDSTAEQRNVKATRAWQDMTVVAGLNPGERVIVEGQLRVKPGAKVNVSERQQPAQTANAIQQQ
jgi:multidrug efflux system membrane fusion protein